LSKAISDRLTGSAAAQLCHMHAAMASSRWVIRAYRVVGSGLGEGLLLFVGLDRTRANIALASLQVARLAPAVLA
jgi:hypothetical protein